MIYIALSYSKYFGLYGTAKTITFVVFVYMRPYMYERENNRMALHLKVQARFTPQNSCTLPWGVSTNVFNEENCEIEIFIIFFYSFLFLTCRTIGN